MQGKHCDPLGNVEAFFSSSAEAPIEAFLPSCDQLIMKLRNIPLVAREAKTRDFGKGGKCCTLVCTSRRVLEAMP